MPEAGGTVRRPALRRDDRGSLPLAILVSIVAAALVGLLIPMLVVQVKSTTFSQSRTQELGAAQAGLNVGLGSMRAAATVGDLPCGEGVLAGAVDQSAGAPTYRAVINYYMSNPAGKDAAWLAAARLTCPLSDASPPQFAAITATGSDNRAARTLQSVYAISTGGTIYLWNTERKKFCISAPEPAVVGGAVTSAACTAADGTPTPAARQIWVYTSTGQLKLVSSDATGALCLTVNGGYKLSACDTLVTTQKWTLGSNVGRINGSDGRCIGAGASGGPLVSAVCAASTASDPTQRWVFSPSTGAGSAAHTPTGTNYRQYVNLQTSRCIDGTGDVAAARMCQTVADAALATSPQGIAVDAGTNKLRIGTGKCLSVVAGKVAIAACSGAVSWTIDAAKGTIARGGNQCLTLATDTRDFAADGFPKLLIASCDATALQQWTARSDRSGVFDIQEIGTPVSVP